MTVDHRPKGRPHDNEQRGIRRIVTALDDTAGDYLVYSNIELPTRRAGHTYEHDLVVVAPHALFTIELKSYGGRIRGNRDRWTLEDGTLIQSPIPLVTHKARVLKGQLQARHHALADLWVQGLVFVTGLDARLELSPDFADFVVTLDDVIPAITRPEAFGLTGRRIDPRVRRHLVDYLDDGQPAPLDPRLGPYRLIERLLEADRDAPFEAWRAERNGIDRRVHLYRIKGADTHHRARLRERAMREASLLERLRGAPHLVGYLDYDHIPEPEEAVVLAFEDDTDRMPLTGWLETAPPALAPRLAIATQLVDALRAVHDRDIVHRRLSPDAVFIAGPPDAPRATLGAFDLARDLTGATATLTPSQLDDPSYRCAAPELLKTAEATRRTDRFALGATLHALLTGHLPFDRPEAVLAPYTVPPLHLGTTPIPRDVDHAVRELLAADPMARPELDDVAAALDRATRPRGAPRPLDEPAPDAIVNDLYTFVTRLGEGATGQVWRMRHLVDGTPLIAKLAPAEHDGALQTEWAVLRQITHPHLVRPHNIAWFGGQRVLLLEDVDGLDGRLWAEAGDPLDAARLERLGAGLFGALGALHAAGWLHRDVKPDNLLLTEPDARPTLIDLGLALDTHTAPTASLAVGTAAYKDPTLYTRGAWSPIDDLFAAWITLYEITTGEHPFAGQPEEGAAPRLDPQALPPALDPAHRAALVDAFAAGLDPDPRRRPATASAAADRWTRASTATTPPLPLPTTPKRHRATLPDDLTPDTPLATLDLSTRAHTALLRLGLTIAGQLPALTEADLRELRGVGHKTTAELLALAAAARHHLGDTPTAPRRPPAPEPFYRPLIGDDRPLTDLTPTLGPRLVDRLITRGLTTLGALAGQPDALVARTRGLGPDKLAALRAACARLAGDDTDRPDTLDALDHHIRRHLGRPYPRLAAAFGLHDGTPRTPTAIAEAEGVTRPAITQWLTRALDALTAPGAPGHWLTAAATASLPRAGFAPLAATAAALRQTLPATAPLSHLGYTRLAAALLAPPADRPAPDRIEHVLRPPWTPATLLPLRVELREAITFPPLARRDAAALLAARVDPTLRPTLARHEIDRDHLLDAAIALDPDIAATAAGDLYRRPAPRPDPDNASTDHPTDGIDPIEALEAAHIDPAPGDTLADLTLRLTRYYGAPITHLDPAALTDWLTARGLRLDADRIADIDRARPEPLTRVIVDIDLPPARRDDHLDLAPLLAALPTGGFRVAVLDLATHHRDADHLTARLTDALGPHRVRALDLDRHIIEALIAQDLWTDALFDDAAPHPDFAPYATDIHRALDHALHGPHGPAHSHARPGTLTVLTRPALLGHLGQTRWLHGLYERARGGRHGLILLALPGGIRDGRLRLNERHPIPYTPDMGALDLRRHPHSEPPR